MDDVDATSATIELLRHALRSFMRTYYRYRSHGHPRRLFTDGLGGWLASYTEFQTMLVTIWIVTPRKVFGISRTSRVLSCPQCLAQRSSLLHRRPRPPLVLLSHPLSSMTVSLVFRTQNNAMSDIPSAFRLGKCVSGIFFKFCH